MTKPINFKQEADKIIVDGSGFVLLKQLKAKIDHMNQRIEKGNQLVHEGKELTENQKDILEKLKEDTLLFESIHETFQDIIVEDSYLIVYLQKLAQEFEKIFPGKVRDTLMPSQIKAIEDMKEVFESVKEIFNNKQL